MYEAQCVALKKRELAKTKHKPPIADEDIKRLYESGVFKFQYRQSHFLAKQSVLGNYVLFLSSRVAESSRTKKR